MVAMGIGSMSGGNFVPAAGAITEKQAATNQQALNQQIIDSYKLITDVAADRLSALTEAWKIRQSSDAADILTAYKSAKTIASDVETLNTTIAQYNTVYGTSLAKAV